MIYYILVKQGVSAETCSALCTEWRRVSMLLNYVVSNFESIGHPIEFSMFPTAQGMERDDRFLKTIRTKAGDWEVLCRAGFFGPNASGKTAFMESIAYAQNFILEGRRSGKGTGVVQFKGQFEDLQDRSMFQFTFFLDGEVYEYGFTLDRRQVYEEWLMLLCQGERDLTPLFSRQTDEQGKTEIELYAGLTREGTRERELAEILTEGLGAQQSNQLFLRRLSENGVKRAEQVIAWFETVQVIYPDSQVQALPLRMQRDSNFKEFIAESLKKLGTGVTGVTVARDEVDFYDLAGKMALPETLVEKIEEMGDGIISYDGKYFLFEGGEGSQTVMLQLKFQHLLNGKVVSFDWKDESDGTKRLLDLLPILFWIKERKNAVFFLDEIDRSLHTKLTRYLLEEFAAKGGNTQIIFTAHDVNLIDLDAFRQDELWLIEKNNAGESQLRPLSDFDLREGQDTLKAYLSGRFGAVPVIRREYG